MTRFERHAAIATAARLATGAALLWAGHHIAHTGKGDQ